MRTKHYLYIAAGYLVLAYVNNKYAITGYTLPLDLISKVIP